MSRGSIGDPQKFQLASIVTKNSRTGITSNRRLLVVKAGHLYYYSNIPKSFTGDNIKILQQFHELPKCSIQILRISRVNGFEPTSSYFSIEFQAKHMLQREDIRRTLVNEDFNFTPRNTKELVTWQFTCDNQFIKQRWVSALLHLKDYYKSEQLNIQKYFDTIVHQQPKSSNGSISSRSSLKVSPWRESVASRKSYTLDNSKYGLQFRESPKESSNKIQETFLKKGRSEDQRGFNYPQFQMVIKVEQPRQARIEQAFKVHQVKKEESPKETTAPIRQEINVPPPVIEQVIEQPSISQTPIKENSYSDSQDHIQRRASMEKTLNDLKLFSETHRMEFPPQEQTPQVPLLKIVEERPEMNSKVSNDFNVETKSNEQRRGRDTDRQMGRKSQQKLREKGREMSSVNPPSGSDFEWLFGECCRNTAKFDYRLQRQKQLISLYSSFKQIATAALSQWIQSKSRGQHRYQSSEIVNNRSKLVLIGNIQLKVAMLTTQNILINNKPRIFFNEDAIKNLKRQYKVYQNVSKMLMRRLKQEPSLKLRPPLAVYIEYKGVCCIVFDRTQVRQSVVSDDEEWISQRSVLQEEGYKAEWFNYSQLNGYLTMQLKLRGKGIERDEQTLKEYLKRVVRVGSQQKNHNMVFDSPIDRAFLQCAQKQNASTSAESMERYIKGLKAAKGLQGACPKEEIIAALEYCLFCKNLRRVYRSAQGEIDETHFFNLVFKGDPAMAPLLEQSACPPLPSVIKGQLFSFIQHYFGAYLEVDQGALTEMHSGALAEMHSSSGGRKKKDLFFSCSSVPLIRQYPFNELQIVESFGKLPLYLQSRHHLAEAALSRKKEILHISNDSLPLTKTLELLYDEACFFYGEADFVGCIKKCRQYQEAAPQRYTRLFAVYLLTMKAYSQFSESDFSLAFRKATELIEFNYGVEHSSLVSLCSLAAYYYSQFAAKEQQRQQALSIAAGTLLRQAEQLCLRHFGRSSKQFLDILLDLSRLHRRGEPALAQKYLAMARQACEENVFLATAENVVSLQSYQAELHLQFGNTALAESALLSALGHLTEKVSLGTRKHITKLQYQLGFYQEKYQYCSQAVQRLWEMGEKFEAVELAYRAAIRSSGSQGEGLVDENNSMRFQGRQRALMQIQGERGEHGGLMEMVAAAIQAKNGKLLTMIHFLSRRE